MIIRVIDFETTGVPTSTISHALCEVGWCDVDPMIPTITTPNGYRSLLVNPGRPMPPDASAVHHLVDADVRSALDPGAALIKLGSGTVDVFCAHNADFEKQFFTGGETPWIDTIKVAYRLWPESPSFSNQALRYFLGLDLAVDMAMPPHRAGPDTYVTACI